MKKLKCLAITMLVICIASCSKEEVNVNNDSDVSSKSREFLISPVNSENPYDEIGALHNNALVYLLEYYNFKDSSKFDNELSFEILDTYMNTYADLNYEVLDRLTLQNAFNQAYFEEGLLVDSKVSHFLSLIDTALNESNLSFHNQESLPVFINLIKEIETTVEETEFDTENGKIVAYISLAIARYSAYFWNNVHNDPNSNFAGIFAAKSDGSKKIAKADAAGAVGGIIPGAVGGPAGAVVGAVTSGIGASWAAFALHVLG